MAGRYIVFEAVDGVGKTTTLKAVSTCMTERGIGHIVTKEPGGPGALHEEWPDHDAFPLGPVYEGFRQYCVDHPQIPQLVKRALYKADSIYNWVHVVKPALDNGIHVLSDRSWVSDLAYGSVLTNASITALYSFNTALVPDQAANTEVVMLDCHEVLREERLAVNMTNEMDKLGPAVRNNILRAYEETLKTYAPVWHLFLTESPPAELAKKIVDTLFAP